MEGTPLFIPTPRLLNQVFRLSVGVTSRPFVSHGGEKSE